MRELLMRVRRLTPSAYKGRRRQLLNSKVAGLNQPLLLVKRRYARTRDGYEADQQPQSHGSKSTDVHSIQPFLFQTVNTVRIGQSNRRDRGSTGFTG